MKNIKNKEKGHIPAPPIVYKEIVVDGYTLHITEGATDEEINDFVKKLNTINAGKSEQNNGENTKVFESPPWTRFDLAPSEIEYAKNLEKLRCYPKK